ncbi:MAG: hypothetical protein ACYCWW_12885 [Deltaproteobacteria bacterium]
MPRQYLILAVVSWLGLSAAAACLSAGPLRVGLAGGLATAGLAGACTFGALSWSAARALPSVIKAAAAGFLVRLLLLAAGAVLTLRLGGSPVGFGGGFFAFYLLCQGIEVASLQAKPRAEVRP